MSDSVIKSWDGTNQQIQINDIIMSEWNNTSIGEDNKTTPEKWTLEDGSVVL